MHPQRDPHGRRAKLKPLLKNRWLGALGALLLLGTLSLAAVAFADVVQNDIALEPSSDTITAGGSTEIGYRIHATSNDVAGCNVDATHTATVTINVPAEVTVDTDLSVAGDQNTLSFTACETFQQAKFSSSAVGDHEITVSVTGGKAGSGWNVSPAAFLLDVLGAANSAPTVSTPAGDANGIEGDTLEASGAFSDPDSDTLALTADNTEGTFTDNGDGTWSWSLPTTDDVPPHTVTVTADDGHGHTATDSFGYSAANAAPSIDNLGLSASNCDPTLSFGVSDPGSADTHTGTVDWGDSSVDTSFADGDLPFSQSHHYSSAGTYTIQVDVSDDDGGVDSDSSSSHSVHNVPSAILQPVNANGSSVFKLGSTIPVKITVADCDANSVSSLAPQVSVVKLTAGVEGTVIEATSTATPTSGTTMRYDATAAQYIYNLATKPLTAGTWRVKIHDGSFAEDVKADFSLKK